MKMGEKVNIYL